MSFASTHMNMQLISPSQDNCKLGITELEQPMIREKRHLVEAGIQHFPFPMAVASRANPEGQHTIADISITARLMQEFETGWIDKFIQIAHRHRECIGTETLRANIIEYMQELHATNVEIDFAYPFFVEKLTPVSNEKCLTRYSCTYSSKASSLPTEPRVRLAVEVPVITTYPGSSPDRPTGLFGQLSIVRIKVEPKKEIYPEDLVDLVDQHALSPVYSFLTPEDQAFIIEKVHTEVKSSVAMTDEIKASLAQNLDIAWYWVHCSNFGMLHSYSTFIATEKSSWVPFSSFDDEQI